MGVMEEEDDKEANELMDAEASDMDPRYSLSIPGEDSRENDPAWDNDGEGDIDEA